MLATELRPEICGELFGVRGYDIISPSANGRGGFADPKQSLSNPPPFLMDQHTTQLIVAVRE